MFIFRVARWSSSSRKNWKKVEKTRVKTVREREENYLINTFEGRKERIRSWFSCVNGKDEWMGMNGKEEAAD